MARPSKQQKSYNDKSILNWLSSLLPFLANKNVIGVNFNISTAMKSYRRQTQKKILDSNYVNSELFESVMDAFDEIKLEELDVQHDPSLSNRENQSDMVKDGEFTLIFSKKKSNKNVKNKSSKNAKSERDSRQQALPNIVG